MVPWPGRPWWQKRHSNGWKPLPCSSHKLFAKNPQPLWANSCRAKSHSLPRNAGESTPKAAPGAISSIILPPNPACRAAVASTTVHQPGREQNWRQSSHEQGSEGGKRSSRLLLQARRVRVIAYDFTIEDYYPREPQNTQKGNLTSTRSLHFSYFKNIVCFVVNTKHKPGSRGL